MKKYLILLALSVNFILWALIILVSSTVSAQVSQVVNIAQAEPTTSVISSLYGWVGDNWQIIALIVSEVAALLPTKINGIVQGIIRMFSGLFDGKTKATK